MKLKMAGDKIVRRKVQSLIPYERNSKVHPDKQIEQIAKSIEEWGWTIPILIDEKDHMIAGHGRLFAADHLGLTEVPCIVAKGWSEAQRRAYVIADNKLAEQSMWNDDLLYSEMNALLDDGFDVELMAVEIDPATMGYEPNMAPIIQFPQVNKADVDKAGDALQNQVSGISGDKASDGHEVMCPYCAATFKFSGT